MSVAPERSGDPPVLRDLLLAPPLLRGASPVHLVRDRRAGRSYELRPQVAFVVAGIQRGESREQLAQRYRTAFGRELTEKSWTSILEVLAARGLLAAPESADSDGHGDGDGDGDGDGHGDADGAAAGRGAGATGLWRASWRMGGYRVPGAPSGVRAARRALAPVLNRGGLAVSLLLVLGAAAQCLSEAPRFLRAASGAVVEPPVFVAALLLLWASTALHELAHGVAADRLGGTVSEIGVFWRIPLVVPYCKVDDVLFLSRAGGVLVSLAGCLANVVFAVPFVAMWFWLPAGPVTHGCALLAALCLLVALANLMPVGRLDGAKAVGQRYGLLSLSEEAARYRGLRRAGKDDVDRYPQRARRVYRVLGVAAPGCAALVAALAAALVFGLVRPHTGTGWALGVDIVLAAAVVTMIVTQRRAQRVAAARQRQAGAAATPSAAAT